MSGRPGLKGDPGADGRPGVNRRPGLAGPAGRVFRLPDLGEGLTEAEVVEWRVAVGDRVQVDQIVVEVETAKAAVEVPVPFAGTVLELHAAAGSVVDVGAPLISVGVEGAGAPGNAEGAGGSGSLEPTDPAAERYRREEQAGSGNVLVGYGTGRAPAGRRRSRGRTAGRTTARTPATPAAGLANTSSGALAPSGDGPASRGGAPAVSDGARAVRVISPLVRRLAREHGLELAAIATSEPDGVIRRRDVEAALAGRPAGPPEPDTASDGVARDGISRNGIARNGIAGDGLAGPDLAGESIAGKSIASDGSAGDGVAGGQVAGRPGPVVRDEERIPLRGVRRAITEKLIRSRAEIPDATTWVDVDATGLLAARDALAPGPRRVGLLALLARIAVAGLGRFPELNASVDTEHNEIVRHRHINVGFAAQTDRGLVVPVVRGAHALTSTQISDEIARLTDLARAGHLPPEALTGGTFTLNNYGVFGVDGSAAIINHPEAAILGIGRIVDKPWVVDGELRVRKVTQLSLSFDHRVCDGAAAGGFLRYVADCVENPYALLADV